MLAVWLALPGLLIWLGILLVPWRPWSVREALDAAPGEAAEDLSDVTVVIPARNEAAVIARTLRSLSGQGQGLRVLLVDDQSTDDTTGVAAGCGLPGLEVLNGKPLPRGWTGKLWALEQAREQVGSTWILQIDADIELRAGIIAALLRHARERDLALVSLMARLRMENAWERMLMPAFVYFFRLLYPFTVSNSPSRLVAAAAGGCILLRSDVLRDMGGYGALRSELIDDCALARRVKDRGGRTWIGLTHSVISHREYHGLAIIWDMVARTAFSQLRHSALLLLLCTCLMGAAFMLPLAVMPFGAAPGNAVALLALLCMEAGYIPTLRYYDVPLVWGLALPLTGVLFLLMTWSSALRYWFGSGAHWKDRHYARVA